MDPEVIWIGMDCSSRKRESRSFLGLEVVAYTGCPPIGLIRKLASWYSLFSIAFTTRVISGMHPTWRWFTIFGKSSWSKYTIQISIKTQVDGVKDLDCPGFSRIHATSPFGSRTHILSNPLSHIQALCFCHGNTLFNLLLWQSNEIAIHLVLTTNPSPTTTTQNVIFWHPSQHIISGSEEESTHRRVRRWRWWT